jgi:hypothetical protein
MADGFMQSAAGLAGLQQQSPNLRAAVDGGQLFINPDSAQNAAQACYDHADKLEALAMRASNSLGGTTSVTVRRETRWRRSSR